MICRSALLPTKERTSETWMSMSDMGQKPEFSIAQSFVRNLYESRLT